MPTNMRRRGKHQSAVAPLVLGRRGGGLHHYCQRALALPGWGEPPANGAGSPSQGRTKPQCFRMERALHSADAMRWCGLSVLLMAGCFLDLTVPAHSDGETPT